MALRLYGFTTLPTFVSATSKKKKNNYYYLGTYFRYHQPSYRNCFGSERYIIPIIYTIPDEEIEEAVEVTGRGRKSRNSCTLYYFFSLRFF